MLVPLEFLASTSKIVSSWMDKIMTYILVRPAPATSHFKDVNILGADFCALHNVRAIANYKSKEAKLVFLRSSMK